MSKDHNKHRLLLKGVNDLDIDMVHVVDVQLATDITSGGHYLEFYMDDGSIKLWTSYLVGRNPDTLEAYAKAQNAILPDIVRQSIQLNRQWELVKTRIVVAAKRDMKRIKDLKAEDLFVMGIVFCWLAAILDGMVNK